MLEERTIKTMSKKKKKKRTPKTKNPGARPTKINNRIIKAFEKVVSKDINAIILTDEELVLEANDLLKKKDRFSYSAFKDWKAFAINTKKKSDTSKKNYKLYMKIRSVIKKALRIQKQGLFKSMENEPTQWQRWAWIIERKFDAWNIRQKSDITSKGDRLSSLVAVIQKQDQPLVNEENKSSQRSDNGGDSNGEVKEPGVETKESILD